MENRTLRERFKKAIYGAPSRSFSSLSALTNSWTFKTALTELGRMVASEQGLVRRASNSLTVVYHRCRSNRITAAMDCFNQDPVVHTRAYKRERPPDMIRIPETLT